MSAGLWNCKTCLLILIRSVVYGESIVRVGFPVKEENQATPIIWRVVIARGMQSSKKKKDIRANTQYFYWGYYFLVKGYLIPYH